ncbi:hypothetical protein [Paenarthrobacter aurescens]|uniref:Integral membrane protein n=1 Tax=Paenarthrobacter aurescens TaxID=43663 RepID=A0A4Y3NCN6_PAEAU|nr:hypothetical protein [Paenarthrobacter aurescens]MDO6142374.1 hypothetical protein [Paenarthrobacter aurescens]MDO6146221.1 hypothetical protein [Paenarthrobacter aurescens]MDO6157466.1 hypothetical protein [Paenarthrobacter aurescens]MDO6161451.1 hypothetical protein [Paenarthrobacter aurescens]GEB18907.1 hypothetical protein AAU01_16620 [Paenarthrobacter aurescens]
MEQFTEVPGDRTASILAYSAAGVGVAGVLTLGAMYAVEVPKGGPFVFGAINDATGAVFNVLVIPVILQVHKRLPQAPWTEPLKWVTAAACAAGATSSALLVLKVMDFGPSTAVSVAAIVIQGLWFFVANNKLLHVDDYPKGFAKLGRFIGGSLLIGLPLAGLGFLIPGPEWLRYAVMGAGFVAGASSWAAWPYWYFKAGKFLGHKRAVETPRGAAPEPA